MPGSKRSFSCDTYVCLFLAFYADVQFFQVLSARGGRASPSTRFLLNGKAFEAVGGAGNRKNERRETK